MFRRLPNLTNALVVGGLVALGIGIYLPAETAERTSKVETRAEEGGRALLATALQVRPMGPLEDARAELLEVFRQRCAELGHPSSYLPDAKDPPPTLAGLDCALFDSKHYGFMLVRGDQVVTLERGDQVVGAEPSPPDLPTSRPVDDSTDPLPGDEAAPGELTKEDSADDKASESATQPWLPFEVYAWPLSRHPPGHTAFFFPERGDAAFTRNLMHQYVGWDETLPRAEMPRPGAGVPKKTREGRAYRGRDDERWLVFFGHP